MAKKEKEKEVDAKSTSTKNEEVTVNEPTPSAAEEMTKASKPKKVEVEADVLEKLLQKVEDLEKVADVGRMTRLQEARESGKLVKEARVNKWEGKYVLAWSRIKDDVYFDAEGRLHEDQQVELTLFVDRDKDGKMKTEKTEPVSYRAFSRLTEKETGEVIKESKDSDGAVHFTVLLSDGLELEIPIIYLN